MAILKLKPGVLEINLAGAWFSDQQTPQSEQLDFVEAVQGLARRLFFPQSNALDGFDQCGEIQWTRLIGALRNAPPGLVASVEGILQPLFSKLSDTPLLTKHFAIYDAPDPGVGETLETALEKIWMDNPDFQLDNNRVVFCKLGRIRGMTSPGEPIFLNQELFTKEAGSSPSFLIALAAHELFHKVQYRWGFRSSIEEMPYAWRSEGTASWAEHRFSGGTLTGEQKLLAMFDHPEMGLLNASYYAFPFWLPRNLNWIRRHFHPPVDDSLARLVEDSLKRRLVGTWHEEGALFRGGKDSIELHPELRAKQITPGRGVLLNGWLPKFGAHVFRIPPRTSKEITNGLVEPISGFKPEVFAVFAKEEGPYTLRVGARATNTARAFASRILPLRIGGWSAGFDGAGNVLLSSPDGSGAVLGFSVNGFSSIGKLSLTEPAAHQMFFENVQLDEGMCTVRLRSMFSPSITVERFLSISGSDRAKVQVITRTDHRMQNFESILLTGDRENPWFSYDGESSARCKLGSSDCDGDCRPLWPVRFEPDTLLPPIVPFAGQVIQPVASPGSMVTETHIMTKF